MKRNLHSSKRIFDRTSDGAGITKNGRFSGNRLVQSCGIIGFAFLLQLVVCTAQQTSGPGGGTDFPNTKTVAGIIVREDGSAASSALVLLLSSTYEPGRSGQAPADTGSTDATGAFTLSVPDSGTFTVAAVAPSTGTRLLITGISAEDHTGDTVRLDTAVLRNPGSLAVKIPDSLKGTAGRFYLPGTDVFAEVDTDAAAVALDSVPAGTVPPLFFTRKSGNEPSVQLGDSICVTAKSTVVIAPEYGDTAVALVFNTSELDTIISQTVTGFPLGIMVSQLPDVFRTAVAQGQAVTVTNDRFVELPLERESPGKGNTDDAVVWVLVDTISPEVSGQALYLFINGNGAAVSGNNDRVFDTANGFTAVWHLENGCTDATVNGFDGMSEGGVVDVNGVAGAAKRFDGNGQITVPGLMGKPQTVTLSAWAKLDSAVARGAEVVSIGDAALIRMDDTWRSKGCQGAYCSNPDAADTITHEYIGSDRYLAKSGWHYMTYGIDATTMRHRFYIDGELIGEKTMPVAVRYDRLGSDVVIGNHGNGKTEWNFVGSIDEVRVEHCVRSISWIRLCYESQRPGSGLLSVLN